MYVFFISIFCKVDLFGIFIFLQNLAETKEKLEDADTIVARLQTELHNQAEQLRLTVAEQQKNLDEGAVSSFYILN